MTAWMHFTCYLMEQKMWSEIKPKRLQKLLEEKNYIFAV